MISRSKLQTQQIAKKLARKLLNAPHRTQASVIALQGDLGAGKTTFTQGFARGLEIHRHITSPTFLIIRRYGIPKTDWNFYHLDLYQIKKAKEILDLGFKEIIRNPKNIVIIEWAEKIKSFLMKKKIIHVDFKHTKNENKRVIRLH
ncbi:MAG TPA: tRNA (adenosine(37)-N6)-threonylcarbamoyltransferase complex ATPase subunit type 1 TsaE [Candidatus Paceibacterota bacterium]